MTWQINTHLLYITQREKLDFMESSYSNVSLGQSEESMFKPVKKIIQNQSSDWNLGEWSQEEKMRYAAFMMHNRVALQSKIQRRTNKVFKQMSSFIGTRSPTQCRSQNQKMLKRCGTSNRVVNKLKSELGVEYFEDRYRELVEDGGNAQENPPDVKEEQKELVRPVTQEKCTQTEGHVLVLAENEIMQWNMFKQSMSQPQMFYAFPA